MTTPNSAYDLAYGQDPIPLDQLALIFTPGNVATTDLAIIEEIRQKLSYYLYCIDGHTTQQLHKVFVSDIIANYSEPLGYLAPLKVLEEKLAEVTDSCNQQHLSGTQ
jgi:hypothetical protein